MIRHPARPRTPAARPTTPPEPRPHRRRRLAVAIAAPMLALTGLLASLLVPGGPVVAATTLFGAVMLIVANLIVDMLYSVLDPRVRLS